MADKEAVALTLRVTPEMAKKIKTQAKREGLTVNAFIISVLNAGNVLLSEKEWKQRIKEDAEYEAQRKAEANIEARVEALEKAVLESKQP